MLCAVAVAAAFAGPANAIYKCTTVKGTVYQDRPCREGNETDVNIVIPTGEVAPRNQAAPAEGTSANGPRAETGFSAPKPSRTASDDPVSRAKPADRKSGDAAPNAADATRKKEPQASAENAGVPMTPEQARKKEAQASAENAGVPMTPEQARKTDPAAKYYATDGFGTGTDTPAQMNCESPTGEKRVFYLSNGKLTSI
jgi:hypothetical protein